jgi:predicted TIM-barrel fold metal-dependent hydrolase
MIIDFHAHYSPAFFRYREYRLSLDEMLARMDAHGITRAVVSAAGEYAALLNAEGNAAIADAVRRHPGRLIGFAAINPWWRARALEELQRAREGHGFAGIVIHPILQGFEANDPLVFPLIQAAVESGMIVYVTGGAPYLAMPEAPPSHSKAKCPGRESNPHGPYGPRDFKSLASACSATRAC